MSNEYITFSAERASVQTLLISWELTCVKKKEENSFQDYSCKCAPHKLILSKSKQE